MALYLNKIIFFLAILFVCGFATKCKDKSYPCPSYADSPKRLDTSSNDKSFIKGFRKNKEPETGLLKKGKNKNLDKELKKIRKRKRKRLKRGR